MGEVHPLSLPSEPVRVAIVISQFNQVVVERLLAGALEELAAKAPAGSEADVYWVPGAFEIPAMARRCCENEAYDGVLTLGALIKGETEHYEVLAHSVAAALQSLSWSSEIPLCFGVLTCGTIALAMDRAGGRSGNKGAETMLALLQMIALFEGEAA